MEFSAHYHTRTDEIVSLFETVFSASESSEEGKLVGRLSKNILETTRNEDIFAFIALSDDELTGCSVFSRLSFAEDDRTAFILSPMAVATSRQAGGVGKALLTYGLNALRDRGVDVAVTYGDPNYYKKVGFAPTTENVVPAPVALNRPEGWLAQSLTDRPLHPFKGASRCVDALMDPIYW